MYISKHEHLKSVLKQKPTLALSITVYFIPEIYLLFYIYKVAIGVRKATLRNCCVLECSVWNEYMTDMQRYYIKPFFMMWCECVDLMCVKEQLRLRTTVQVCAGDVTEQIVLNEQRTCS